MVQSGTRAYLYVNGQLESDVSFTYNPVFVADDLYVGKHPGYWGAFNGEIDEAAIWDKALTATEIIAVYNSGNSLDVSSNSGDYQSASNLQGYWDFNEHLRG